MSKITINGTTFEGASVLQAVERVAPLPGGGEGMVWYPHQLPEYGVRVLATDMYEGDDYTGIRTREEYPDDADGCWYDEWGRLYAIDDVTHWMPLPEPPEVEL